MSKKAIETCTAIDAVIHEFKKKFGGKYEPTAADRVLETIEKMIDEALNQTIPSTPIAMTRDTADQIALTLLRDIEEHDLLDDARRYDMRIKWTDRILEMSIPVPGFMVVQTDNFDRSGESPGHDERVIACGIRDQLSADIIAGAMNEVECRGYPVGHDPEKLYKVCQADYVLREFRP